MLVIFAGLMIYDRVSAGSPRLVFSTNSAEAEYDATPLTNHQWTLLNGGLKTGHKIITTFTGSRTDAGISENTMTAIIVDENGKDVTDEYIVSYEYGTLKINHRILRLDASTDFKNITAVNGRYTLTSQELGLVANHFALVFVSTTTDELGLPVESIEDVKVYDENRNEVTHNYQIFIREKGETILITGPDGNSGGGSISPSLAAPPDGGSENAGPMFSVRSSVSGTVYFRTLSCGDYLGNEWGTAPTFSALYDDQYAASYLTSFFLKEAGFSLNQMEIVSYIGDYPLPYYAAVGNGYAIQRNDTVNMGPTDSSYTVPFYMHSGIILSRTYNDDAFENAYRNFVYENYTAIDRETLTFMSRIIKSQGFTKSAPDTIQQVASYIKNAAKYNKDYDRGLDVEPNNAVAFLGEYKEGVCRHYATAATMLFRALGYPARYTIGAVADVTAGTWVDVMPAQAHAWVEVYIDGVGWIPVEVTGGNGSGGGGGVCEDCGDGECDGNCGGGGGGGGGGAGGNEAGQPTTLELVPKTVTKRYDGTPLVSNNRVSGLEELERLGYTYNAVIRGSQTKVGVAQSIIESITIYDPRGQDVTSAFTLETKPGRIHVYLYEITFRTRDIQQVYNGRSPASGLTFDGRKLAEGDFIHFAYTADPNVGTKLVTYDITIYDNNHQDVTDFYLIHKEYGTAVITPLEITLQAGSATKKYDGTALVCEDFYLLEGSLIPRHSFAQVTTSGVQIDIGRCENIITSVIIVDAEGNDMTGNYTIRLESGTLRVKGS